MKLYIDIGNTLTKFDVEDKGIDKVLSWPTNDLLNFNYDFFSSVDFVRISSVVPNATKTITKALKALKIINIEEIKSTTPVEFSIIMDNPSELGSDLFCDMVGAHHLYKEKVIVVDLGTASKILVLEKNSVFKMCVIFPGVQLSFKSLNDNTALLKNVEFTSVKDYKDCHNTMDILTSSIIYSQADSINCAIKRIERELGYKCHIILTGGFIKNVKRYFDFEYEEIPHLAIQGLKEITK